MASKAHKVRLAKDSDTPVDSSQPTSQDVPGETDTVRQLIKPTHRRPSLTKKTVAIVVAISILAASGILVWMSYPRHWTMGDVERQVIDEPTKDTPGFKHSLAGRTVTVEGKISNVRSYNTTKGTLNQLWMEDSDNISLVTWGPPEYNVGDSISKSVHFEWANCNGERHVYSAQLDFPWLQMVWYGEVVASVSQVGGDYMIPNDVGEGHVRVTVFDQYPPVSLADSNCSLRAGEHSWWSEYSELLGLWGYGRYVDSIPSLTHVLSENGDISFSDTDRDGNLSAGDWFDLSGIEVPAGEIDMNTYVLTTGRPAIANPLYADLGMAGICYITVMHTGLVRMIPETPYGRAVLSNQTDGTVVATFTRMSTPANWGNVSVILSDSINFCTWQHAGDYLVKGSVSEALLGDQALGSLTVSCSIRDELGNGMIDDGDSILLRANGDGFSSITNYTLAVVWEPMGTQFCHGTFHG